LARRADGIFLAPFEQGKIGPDLFRHACLMALKGWCRNTGKFRGGRSVKNLSLAAFSRVMAQF
jgi:bifunctional non-homologous end joining protein LigD